MADNSREVLNILKKIADSVGKFEKNSTAKAIADKKNRRSALESKEIEKSNKSFKAMNPELAKYTKLLKAQNTILNNQNNALKEGIKIQKEGNRNYTKLVKLQEKNIELLKEEQKYRVKARLDNEKMFKHFDKKIQNIPDVLKDEFKKAFNGIQESGGSTKEKLKKLDNICEKIEDLEKSVTNVNNENVDKVIRNMEGISTKLGEMGVNVSEKLGEVSHLLHGMRDDNRKVANDNKDDKNDMAKKSADMTANAIKGIFSAKTLGDEAASISLLNQVGISKFNTGGNGFVGSIGNFLSHSIGNLEKGINDENLKEFFSEGNRLAQFQLAGSNDLRDMFDSRFYNEMRASLNQNHALFGADNLKAMNQIMTMQARIGADMSTPQALASADRFSEIARQTKSLTNLGFGEIATEMAKMTEFASVRQAGFSNPDVMNDLLEGFNELHKVMGISIQDYVGIHREMTNIKFKSQTSVIGESIKAGIFARTQGYNESDVQAVMDHAAGKSTTRSIEIMGQMGANVASKTGGGLQNVFANLAEMALFENTAGSTSTFSKEALIGLGQDLTSQQLSGRNVIGAGIEPTKRLNPFEHGISRMDELVKGFKLSTGIFAGAVAAFAGAVGMQIFKRGAGGLLGGRGGKGGSPKGGGGAPKGGKAGMLGRMGKSLIPGLLYGSSIVSGLADTKGGKIAGGAIQGLGKGLGHIIKRFPLISAVLGGADGVAEGRSSSGILNFAGGAVDGLTWLPKVLLSNTIGKGADALFGTDIEGFMENSSLSHDVIIPMWKKIGGGIMDATGSLFDGAYNMGASMFGGNADPVIENSKKGTLQKNPLTQTDGKGENYFHKQDKMHQTMEDMVNAVKKQTDMLEKQFDETMKHGIISEHQKKTADGLRGS